MAGQGKWGGGEFTGEGGAGAGAGTGAGAGDLAGDLVVDSDLLWVTSALGDVSGRLPLGAASVSLPAMHASMSGLVTAHATGRYRER